MPALTSSRCGSLTGTITPPGDKSISHRSVILGGIAEGVTTIRGLLEGEDVLHTIAALKALGAKAEKDAAGTWQITGRGLAALHAPGKALDMGNSGTAARLLIGLLAGRSFASTFTGDASLSKRPMRRVMEPLAQMGARFHSTEGKLPLTVTGAASPVPISYRLPVASAQVKSAILLAGLSAEGDTVVIEPQPTRDHTELMLRAFGASITTTKNPDGSETITLTGKPTLRGREIIVPADISSAAFPIAAALLRPGSEVTAKNIGMNPRRTGLIDTLIEMGADIQLLHRREAGGESVADIVARGGVLRGVTVPAARAPSMIDEYPILAALAACAEGETRMLGLGELRVKESDRLALMADGLARCGVTVEIAGDDLIVNGSGAAPAGGATIETAMDHRIAMSFLVLGGASQAPITIDDGSFIATSFPGFTDMMNGLGMNIQ